MKRITFTIFAIVSLALVSCGVKRAISPERSETLVENLIPINNANRPRTNIIRLPVGGQEEKPNNPDFPAQPNPQPDPEREVPPTFPMKDGNGVIITKENGMQITTFPNGEKYYLPDEL